MWDLYLQAMNIPVWRLRQPSENTCIFYRLNNSRGQTVAWMIAEDTGEEDLLIKIAKALTLLLYLLLSIIKNHYGKN